MTESPNTPPPSSPPALSPGLKFALELGPLVVLLVVTLKFGLVMAAIPFAVASLIATAVLYKLQRKVNLILVVSTLAVAGFAALTWFYNDATFLKLKVTFATGAIGLALLVGGLAGRQPLRAIFDTAFQLDDAGWRTLNLRFAIFFLCMAAANEVVRRVVDDEGYVIAQLAVFFPLPIVFMLTQMPLIKRHSIEPPADRSAD